MLINDAKERQKTRPRNQGRPYRNPNPRRGLFGAYPLLRATLPLTAPLNQAA